MDEDVGEVLIFLGEEMDNECQTSEIPFLSGLVDDVLVKVITFRVGKTMGVLYHIFVFLLIVSDEGLLVPKLHA